MERGVAFLILLFSSVASFSNQIVLECGVTTGNSFNGWSVEPYSAFTSINFTEETISFYAENGGDYSIILTRKIETMKAFSSLNLSLGFSNFENCKLNHVDVFASADNKTWENIQINQADYKTVFENPKGFQFIKLVANVSSSNNGYLECTYFKLSTDEVLAITELEDESLNTRSEFFIFFFNRSVNVETQNELPYEVVFTNLAGQVVYSESSVGSTRIESELPDGIYIISVIQNKQVMRTKKVVFAT
jgi:hypothetical protein